MIGRVSTEQQPKAAPIPTKDWTTGDELYSRALGYRTTANDVQSMMNELAAGRAMSARVQKKLFGYFLSVTVLRALAAECMLKAIAFERCGSFEHEHNLSSLYEALDGPTRGLIETIADSHGVASPKRVLRRHRNDFVDWRYPSGKSQSSELLDLDKTLDVLNVVYRRFKNGTAP